MRIAVQMFAVARQLAGRPVVELELAEPATVAQVREQLALQIPELSPLLAGMRIAVNSQYVNDETLVSPEADVACIPPVSGG